MAKIPLKDRPIAFVDGETTGLDPRVHELIELAAVKRNLTGVHVFEAKIKPERLENASPEALAINGYNEKEWQDARPLSEVLPEFVAFVAGTVIAGQNIRFDMGFINAGIERLGLDARIDYHLIDVSTMAYEHLVPLGLNSLSLKNICKFIGIEPEPNMHRALNGAMSAKDVFSALERATWWDRMRWKRTNR